jgi:hypothetical protein
MSFSAIAHRLLKVRPRRGGGFASYFGGDLSILESLSPDVLRAIGSGGRYGTMALAEALADVLLANGSGGGSAGDSLATNAYPGYETLHVKTTGSPTNSGTESFPLDLVAGVAAARAGRRVMIHHGVYQPRGMIPLPNVVGSAAARVVLMGHPDQPMPQIDFGGSVGGFVITNQRYWVFRKLEVRNTSSHGCFRIAADGSSASNLLWEYVYAHLCRAGPGDNLGAIHNQGQSAPECVIRHSHVGDVAQANGALDDNKSAVHAYNWNGLLVEHARLFEARNGCRVKRAGDANPNGWTVRCCTLHDLHNGIEYTIQGGGFPDGAPHFGPVVHDCLFLACSNAVEAPLGETFAQSSGLSVYGCTFGVDCNVALVLGGFVGVTLHSNSYLQTGATLHFSSPGSWLNQLAHSERNANRVKLWRLNGYSSQGVYTSFNAWRNARTNDNPPQLSALDAAGPDLNSIDITNVAAHYVNAAAGNYTRVAGSALIGAGLNGRNIGADSYGPNWSPA